MSTESKNLQLARTAHQNENHAEALKYYSLVKEEDPKNAEAIFYTAYHAYWEETVINSCHTFKVFCNVVPDAVNALAKNSPVDMDLLKDFYEIVKHMPLIAHNAYRDLWSKSSEAARPEIDNLKKLCGNYGVYMIYSFGDAIEANLASNSEAMAIAVNAWKKGVELQQLWPYYKIEKSLIEKYTTKIQKFDSSYVAPKKAGCISLG